MRYVFLLIVLLLLLAYPIDSVRDKLFYSPKETRMLFVGDLMLDRSVREVSEEKGADFIFSCVKPLLLKHDTVFANLEGPVTSNKSKSVGSTPGGEGNYTFTFPLSLPNVLKRHNIMAVSIGNNHIFDFGEEGILETKEALDGAGIHFAGNPLDLENTSTAFEVGDERIALVAFNEFFAPSVEDTLLHIKKYKETSFVVVFAHWGNEYKTLSSQRQRTWARSFAEAGADLVIGAHPHVIQESEVYLGVPIYYSLGNFIFDQYWIEDVRKGLGVSVTLKKGEIEKIEEKYFYLERDRRTCPTN